MLGWLPACMPMCFFSFVGAGLMLFAHLLPASSSLSVVVVWLKCDNKTSCRILLCHCLSLFCFASHLVLVCTSCLALFLVADLDFRSCYLCFVPQWQLRQRTRSPALRSHRKEEERPEALTISEEHSCARHCPEGAEAYRRSPLALQVFNHPSHHRSGP